MLLKPHIHKILLFTAIFITPQFLQLKGQDINLRIRHITNDQGLSQNTVGCILKDKKGFLWVGTWNGLNRYDGYNFSVFKSDNNKNSLSNNFIYAMCQDKDGNIWIGTKNGLNQLIYAQNRFKRYYHDIKNLNSISHNQVNALLCDHKGQIWTGTNDGLDLLIKQPNDTNKLTIRHYKHTSLNHNTLPENKITAIIEDRQGNLWVGTTLGLAKFDPRTGLCKNYINNPLNTTSLSSNNVICIFQDHKGSIWIGTELGLNKFDPASQSFKRYQPNPDNPKSISHLVVNSINEDCKGTLLIGTLGGLNRYREETDNFEQFPISKDSDYGFNNEFINNICTDAHGNVWIGTDKGGVNSYNVFQKEFGFIGYNPQKKQTLNNSSVNSILEEPSFLWIGTAGGGLNCIDRQTKQFKYFTSSQHNTTSISSNFVSCILRDKSKNLWVGTWGGGMNKLISTQGGGRFERILLPTTPSALSNNYISSLYEDERGFILAGTLSGLILFHPDKKQFTPLSLDKSVPFKIAEVGCILKDRKSFYWIGTRIGLFRINGNKIEQKLTKDDVTRFLNIPGDSTSLSGNYVISLCQDRAGGLWIGTYGNGICKVQFGTGNKVTFRDYTTRQGLANNVVYSILDDNHGNLWLSTDYGLSRFDTRTKSFRNFYVTDGLQSNQFYWAAAFKSNEGKMYFGGVNGLNYFYPENIKSYDQRPNTVITDFKIFNSSVPIGLWNNKSIILTQAISLTDKIKMSYKENVFSFEFSALDFFLPDKVQYAYKMEGVDKDWVYVSANRRFANYTNLKGGRYSFLVKACNSDGIWNPVPTQINLEITPPFWETIWFRILAIILLISALVAYFQIKTRQLQIRRRLLEQQVKDRTAKIEEQKEELKAQTDRLAETNVQLAKRKEQIEGQKIELELKNAEISQQRDKLIELNKHVQLVNQLKIRFFTNISHEFRTPLTLILGALEKLTEISPNNEIGQPVSLARRNAHRLLHLINQLMDFRKIETGKLTLKVTLGDFKTFIENIFTSFDTIAQQRKITYTLTFDNLPNETWFDNEKLENIIYNLISNAFKYTPEGGQITVQVNGIQNKNSITPDTINPEYSLEIKVSDTGIGIPKEHLNNVFKQFYRVDSPENLKIKGSGIGLSLTRSLTRAHHGNVLADSIVGQGTTFTVKFPCSKEFYKPEEILLKKEDIKKADTLPVDVLREELNALTDFRQPDNNPTPSDHKPLLLIVEDNNDLRSFMLTGLNDEYRVLEADNGVTGLHMAKSYAPDLIISDIMMPEMDGLELCTRLKENLLTSHIPVILLTARSTVENWIEGLETGADDYIPKPFNFALLKARISNLIENRKKLRRIFSREINVDPRQITTSTADQQFLHKALKIVEDNFTNSEFGVEEFIKKIGVSRSLLHKKLTAITELSAGDFITSIRLKKSTELLKIKSDNISEIAYAVGFNDPKYFSRIFRKNFGMSPKDYKDSASELNTPANS